jgi:hypothetical protein
MKLLTLCNIGLASFVVKLVEGAGCSMREEELGNMNTEAGMEFIW